MEGIRVKYGSFESPMAVLLGKVLLTWNVMGKRAGWGRLYVITHCKKYMDNKTAHQSHLQQLLATQRCARVVKCQPVPTRRPHILTRLKKTRHEIFYYFENDSTEKSRPDPSLPDPSALLLRRNGT